jgi:hypothetical protein
MSRQKEKRWRRRGDFSGGHDFMREYFRVCLVLLYLLLFFTKINSDNNVKLS